jgi:hypothetical protein
VPIVILFFRYTSIRTTDGFRQKLLGQSGTHRWRFFGAICRMEIKNQKGKLQTQLFLPDQNLITYPEQINDPR